MSPNQPRLPRAATVARTKMTDGTSALAPASAQGPRQVSIRPGINILSVLSHLSYTPWHALAEFVDNAVQSHRDVIQASAEAASQPLDVWITLRPEERRITIRDNAGGIHPSDFPRAFRAAEVPPHRGGLSEFGMGMKCAAFWFSRRWRVRTTALGDPFERTVRFDLDQIMARQAEALDITAIPAKLSAHLTEITLEEVSHFPSSKTRAKAKEHLASMYREFIRMGILRIHWDGEELAYQQPAVLKAPLYDQPKGPSRDWRKDLDLDLGQGRRVRGFVAILAKGAQSRAGLALFRRGRVIQGSADQGWKPAAIFGSGNSFSSQRLFGELHLEGFQISHTKDSFRLEEHEEALVSALRRALTSREFPILRQAEGYRTKSDPGQQRQDAAQAGQGIAEDLASKCQAALATAAADVRAVAAGTLPEPTPLPAGSLSLLDLSTVSLTLDGVTWKVHLEQVAADASDWIELVEPPGSLGQGRSREVTIRLSMDHPFVTQHLAGRPEVLGAALRVGIAFVLGEIMARERHAPPRAARRSANAILRFAFGQP